MISPIRNSSVRLISCNRALTKSGLSDVDYALNPYYGCAHGCLYCYAPDVLRCDRRMAWGNWVEARINISRRLKKEIMEIGRGVIGLSTVTDPYQPAEEKLELTRACLEIISESDASLMLMTKSPLVLRDLDLIERLNSVEVCITVTTLDERISSLFEAKAPTPRTRLSILRKLSDAGIRVDAMISPLLISGDAAAEELKQLIDAIADTGCKSITFDRLRLRETARARLKKSFSGSQKEREVKKIVIASEIFSPEPIITSLVKRSKYPQMTFHLFG